MLGVLARSDALLVRRLCAPAQKAGNPCRIIRARALLLSLALPSLSTGLAEHSGNSYLVPALFQNRSTGWSSKGQPC